MSFPSTQSASASAEQTTDTTLTHRAARLASSRAVFFTAIGLIYAIVIVVATLALNPYFSQTWDVNTFIQAAHRFLDGGNPFDLYAQSRTAQTWPYAYPPLHAFVTAIALFVGNIVPILPEYVGARMPTILADIGVAMVLYDIVKRQVNDETVARVAALLWLFNPITFYNTAVQGHFESEWLLFVLLAYRWFDTSRNIFLATIALAIAVLFKQTAIVFAVPIYVGSLVRWFVSWLDSRADTQTIQRSTDPTIQLTNVLTSAILFAFVIIIVCLPYLLYSDDFAYMNLTYVENVPVQTQSWLVALLGITRATPTAMTSDFFLFRYQTIVTMLATVVIAFLGARRNWSLYLTATLVAIVFFLTSRKVMGYYYVMLFPFLIAELLSKRRYTLLTITTFAVTYISLSPYYASWTNHNHWWIYAALGTLNSAFFVWLFLRMTADRRRTTADPSTPLHSAQDDTVSGQRSAVVVILGLFAGAAGAAILQPLISNNGSPIRAPIITAGLESNALIAFAALIIFIAIVIFIAYRATKNIVEASPRMTFVLILLFAPLFFSVYTLTKESTAVLEWVLKAAGV
ncbi:MAG: hypothetical protein HZB51_23180 [Chloroflexi bacterium]|nr:hypothetical protein [Chloroflexota bacterium]